MGPGRPTWPFQGYCSCRDLWRFCTRRRCGILKINQLTRTRCDRVRYFIFFVLLCTALAAAQTQSDPPVTFSDGAIGTSYDHCGVSDLCAMLTYPNFDKILIYSEGAPYCQPYVLRFVQTSAGVTSAYERPIDTGGGGKRVRCWQAQGGEMVMDHGLIHLTIDQNHDGTLHIRFKRATTY